MKAYSGSIQPWGPYYKYNYVKFDFSQVKEPGIYYILYGKTKTNNFLIDEHVYDKITDATTDVWVPIHMNHMHVKEGYRVWHGEPFKEGYLQAPPSDHFDLHSQGPTTDTKYKPLELIPGLNIGGFLMRVTSTSKQDRTSTLCRTSSGRGSCSILTETRLSSANSNAM